jgi:ornithine carbamoyltransferase
MSRHHLLSMKDLEPAEIAALVERTMQLACAKHVKEKTLEGKAIGIYFRKTSTRTRTSFMLGAARSGALVVTYGPHDLQINTGESIQDTTQVLAGYLDALVLRTAESVEEMKLFAQQETMAIVNAMSDQEHPTQAIADLATLKEHFGSLDGLHILYMGEGNSTAASLALACSKMQGMSLTLLTPEGYGLPTDILAQSHLFAATYKAQVEEYHHLDNLPRGVDVVYTTRWQTTGSAKADPHWKESFKAFSVTQSLLQRVAKPSGTIFMHDLPAMRGEDVTGEVLDGPQSIAFHQAHNKLFGAMAVLEWCVIGS